MTKYSQIVLPLLVLLLVSTPAAAKNRLYGAQTFVGGQLTALDGISYLDGRGKCAELGGTCNSTTCSVISTSCYPLTTNDGCIVNGSAGSGMYYYDATCTDANNALDIIHPVDNPGSGCWRSAKISESQISDLTHTIDTDTDTHLTESEVDGMVANNGYSVGAHTVNTDTHLSNIDISNFGYLKSYTETDPVFLAWDRSAGITISESQISDLAHTTDTDTQLTDAEIASMGYSKIDPDAIGPIGTTTPSTGKFTTVQATNGEFIIAKAQMLELGPQPIGTTGELSLPEDPANPGENTVGWKAPANITTTVKWVLPAADGATGQILTTDGTAHTSWSDLPVLTDPGPIGAIQPDEIFATNIVADSIITNPSPGGTTETLCLKEDVVSAGGNSFCFKADTSITTDRTVLVPSQLPQYTTTCPTLTTDPCPAGQQCYDVSYLYICIADNAWRRTALSSW